MPQLFATHYDDWSSIMSKPRETGLTEVKVEGKSEGRTRNMSSERESQFVYVNSAYVGSVNNVNTISTVNGVTENLRTNRTPAAPAAPITEVYREQYWACSRWPYTQRALAITVGVLLGALIGLLLSIFLGEKEDNVLSPIFTRQHVAAD